MCFAIHIITCGFKKLPMAVLIKLILSVAMIRLWIFYIYPGIMGMGIAHRQSGILSISQARHLGGREFERVARHTPPPSPCDLRAENLPQQHLPPYCTNLQLKMKKNPGGRPPQNPGARPPNPRSPFAQRQLLIQAIFYRIQGVQLTQIYFENTPAI